MHKTPRLILAHYFLDFNIPMNMLIQVVLSHMYRDIVMLSVQV